MKADYLNFKRTTLRCLILSILFIGIIVFNQSTLHNSLPKAPVQICLEKNTDMMAYIVNDMTTVGLPKGDTLSVLGWREGGTYNPPQLLIEASDGQRGFISTIDLGYRHYFMNNDVKDTVEILGIVPTKEKESGKVNIRFSDGKTKEVGYSQLYPIMSDSIMEYQFEDKGWYYMSKKKFERLYTGKSLAEASELYRPYTTAIHTNDGWTVSFDNVKVYNDSVGKFFDAIIYYNDSLMATSYELCRPYGNNAWILKLLPLAETIMDCDFFATLIQSSHYEHHIYGSGFTMAGGSKPWWMWGLVGLYLLLAFIWACCTPMIPAVVMGTAMQCRYTFLHLNDGALAWLIRVITYVCTYIWFVLLLVWGLVWFLAIPIALIALIGPYLATSALNTYPHNRCEKCRTMWRNQYREREILEDYEQWEIVTEKGDLLHQEHSSYKTWTETTWSNGTTTKSNEKTHHVTDSTYAIHHFNVLFRYHPYNDVYECEHCGHLERVRGYTREELERKYMSSGTTTVRSET